MQPVRNRRGAGDASHGWQPSTAANVMFAAQQVLTGGHRPPAVGLLSLHIPAWHHKRASVKLASHGQCVCKHDESPPHDRKSLIEQCIGWGSQRVVRRTRKRDSGCCRSDGKVTKHTHTTRKWRLSSHLPTQNLGVRRTEPRGLTTPGAPCRCPAAAGRSRSCR